MSKSIGPDSHVVDGFRLPAFFSADNFRSAVSYKPRSDDIFLVTYPRCGTTWAANILLLILRKGQPMKTFAELYSMSPQFVLTGAEAVEEMIRPGVIKTHMQIPYLPWSKEAKYIHVTRNPKDCCVSYFHQMKNFPGHNFKGTFDQFFEYFLSGQGNYGDYFDHLLFWYTHRNDPNVLFIAYEELKEDIDSAILKMASFIDDEKYAEPIRRDPQVMSSIKKYSSFEEMKDFMDKGFGGMFKMPEEDLMKLKISESFKKYIIEQKNKSQNGKNDTPDMNMFVRKGIIGDWRNYFTEDQSRRLEEKFIERTKGTDILEMWRKYM